MSILHGLLATTILLLSSSSLTVASAPGEHGASTLQTFLVGTLSSLAAMVLVFVFVRWRWPSVVGWVSASRLFGHGVAFCYPSQREAEPDMNRHFRQSRTIRILCMRAYSLTQPERPFRYLLDDPSKQVRLLLADPGDELHDNPEIDARANEYPKATGAQAYRDAIKGSVQLALAAMTTNSNLDCRLHRLPASFRVYICDDRAFISFFAPNQSGIQLPILTVQRSSPLYAGLLKFFDAVWDRHSRPASSLQYSQG